MKGVYLLEILVGSAKQIRIGALGRISFPAGSYFYVGSAQNGLEQRLARHRRKRKRKHWHIDYLLATKDVRLTGCRVEIAGKSRECDLARSLRDKCEPIPGFGSSDCRCDSHLFQQTGTWEKAPGDGASRGLVVPVSRP